MVLSHQGGSSVFSVRQQGWGVEKWDEKSKAVWITLWTSTCILDLPTTHSKQYKWLNFYFFFLYVAQLELRVLSAPISQFRGLQACATVPGYFVILSSHPRTHGFGPLLLLLPILCLWGHWFMSMVKYNFRFWVEVLDCGKAVLQSRTWSSGPDLSLLVGQFICNLN